MYRLLRTITISLLIAFSFTGCGSQATPKQAEYIKLKTPLYTQRAVWILSRRGGQTFVVQRPFRRGATVLPVNSEVTIHGFKGDLVLAYRGRYVKFLHLKALDENGRYSHETNQQFVTNLLNTSKVDLNKYSQLEQDNIATNTVKEGMSKEAVVLSIGIPTYPQTFSYQDNTWHFQNIMTVVFKDNIVIDVQDKRVYRTKEEH